MSSAAMHHDEDQATLSLHYGRMRMAVQIGILTLLSALVLYVILLSDRHNDSRYVLIASYEADRRSDKILRDLVDAETSRRLYEIREDVKTLLRRGQQPALHLQQQPVHTP
jgi:hypothetical protein